MTQQTTPPSGKPDTAGKTEDIGFINVMKSVFAAFFGVQSNKNRERDFSNGKFWHFLVAGIILLLLFMAAVFGAVQYLLATTPTGGG